MQLRDYIIRRLMVLPILILGVSIVVFTLTRVGGSPIGIYLSHEMTPEEVLKIEERFGLDKPVLVQYIQWLKGIVSGDFGWSGVASAPVAEVFPIKLASHCQSLTAYIATRHFQPSRKHSWICIRQSPSNSNPLIITTWSIIVFW